MRQSSHIQKSWSGGEIEDLPHRDALVAWLDTLESHGGDSKVRAFNAYLQKSEQVEGLGPIQPSTDPPASFCPFYIEVNS